MPKVNTARGRAAGALAKPVQPDDILAAVVGSQPLPRTEITKKVWEYIRQHHLQDPQNRRNINADDKLQALFGGKRQATMFELTKFVNQHIK
jgi:upstream activation factor subunit UAF30